MRTISQNIKYVVLIIFLFINNDLMGEGNVGTSGADFLEIGTGSRPLGMGEAYTGAIGDINSIYYNPAGLGTLKYPVLSLMHQELILDSRFENLSFAMPLYNGFLGFSSSAFWVPSFAQIDIDGNETGKVQFYNTCTTFAYGMSLGFMEIGASLKTVYQRIHTLQLFSLASDIGVLKRLYMYSPFDTPINNFAVGLSLQNFGTKAKDDDLPRKMRIGISYYLTEWFNFNADLTENIMDASDLSDFTSGFNESFRIFTGIEATYQNIIFMRTGYRFNDAGTYTFGMGLNFVIETVNFILDTSYADAGIFGPVYSLTVSFKLIPRIITKDDEIKSEEYYQRGVKFYISDDIESAIDSFKKSEEYNPYHKNVSRKIEDLEELLKLKKEHEELEKENR